MNKYKKDDELSYSFGAFPTYELLTNKTQFVEKLLISEKLTLSPDIEKILNFAKQNNIAIEKSDKQINKIADKDNIYIVGVFRKYKEEINPNKSQILLVNPSDMGNLGTIIRLADWFGISDIVCSADSADCFNPKVVQATMGAILRVRVHYTDLAKYVESLPAGTPVYGTFLEGENLYDTALQNRGVVVMGSEGRGVSEAVAKAVTNKLYIPPYPADNCNTESLNVAIATAIICAEFRRAK